MEIPLKRLKSGFAMPVYGLGTWQMGMGRDEEDINAVKTAIEHGVCHIDSAEAYAAGHAEEIVGLAIQDFERSNLFISTKAWNPDSSYDYVLEACEKSLRRLRTEYIDLYILHRFVPEKILRENMRALDELLDAGKIHAIGVSNFSPEGLELAQSMTKNKIVYDQVHYNLEFREPEKRGLVEYCQAKDVLLAAWRPVQKGALLTEPAKILLEIAQKYGKTPAQIAINWLISQDNVITLAKTSKLEHLEENLGALNWQMESADIEKIRKEYPDQKDVSNSAPLG